MPQIQRSLEAGTGLFPSADASAVTHEPLAGEERVKTLAQKSARSVVEWYPPMVVARHPEVQAVLGVMIPPLGKVMAIGRGLYQMAREFWRTVWTSEKNPS